MNPTAPKMRMATYGDNCVDRYVRPDKRDFVGGNAVNVAVHLAAQGAEAAYFGVTGKDAEGKLVRRALLDHGVDCIHLTDRPGETAVTWIEVRDGERIVLGDRMGAQCPLILDQASLEALAGYPVVHCPLFSSWNIAWREACPRIESEVAFLASYGVFVSADFSDLREPELAARIGRWLGVVFVSRPACASASELEQTRRFFHGCGIKRVVITLAEGGSFNSEPDGPSLRLAAVPIKAVDTLGAGDAFAAGWLFAWASGVPPARCLEAGTRLAAEVCRHFGAWPAASLGAIGAASSEES